jgi:hypothetical protein
MIVCNIERSNEEEMNNDWSNTENLRKLSRVPSLYSLSLRASNSEVSATTLCNGASITYNPPLATELYLLLQLGQEASFLVVIYV